MSLRPRLIALDPDLQALVDDVVAAGGRPLLVGGAIRDALLDLPAKDLDLEVFGLTVERLTRLLGRHGRAVAVGRSFGVLKMTLAGGCELDVALPRRESKVGRGHKGFLVEPDPDMSPREASSRRDFTINALSWDPVSGEVLDFHGGRDDLAARVLRHVGPAFAEDPLRVLRGVQLAGRFDLTAAPATVELAAALLDEADTLSIERVWGEWQKWAASSVRPAAGLAFLAATGWRRRFPELEALGGCPQDPTWHPEGDVWTHTSLVVDAAATIAARAGLEPSERAVLVLAALCHDLGKPETTFREGDRVRSPGHAACDDTVTAFLERIGAPAALAARVGVLTRHHLAHVGFEGSERHVRRLARALGDGGETLTMLARVVEADHSGRPPLPGGLPRPMAEMLAVAERLDAASRRPEPLLKGRHLIELGMAPGVAMGELLAAAFEAQLDGAFTDLGGATAWARQRIDGAAHEPPSA